MDNEVGNKKKKLSKEGTVTCILMVGKVNPKTGANVLVEKKVTLKMP